MEMSKSLTWQLKRFGRFVPSSKQKGEHPWQVFEADRSKPDLVLTIVESGHMIVSQGQELLDGVTLLGASDFLKVHYKSDTLIFRYMLKGENRVVRMQFGGASRAEAGERCSNAVARLMEFLPVTAQSDTPPPPAVPPTTNQTPTDSPAPTEQQTSQEAEMDVENEGMLSTKRLTQNFLGECSLSLPLVYCHNPLPVADLGPFLRASLLDPTFPAFVEEVEGELKKLLQD